MFALLSKRNCRQKKLQLSLPEESLRSVVPLEFIKPQHKWVFKMQTQDSATGLLQHNKLLDQMEFSSSRKLPLAIYDL